MIFNNLSFFAFIFSQLELWFGDLYSVMEVWLTGLFNYVLSLHLHNQLYINSFFTYILIKIKFKLHLLIKLFIKAILNVIVLTSLHFIIKILDYYFVRNPFYLKTVFCFNVISKFIKNISLYFRLKWCIIAICSYLTVYFILLTELFPTKFNFLCEYIPDYIKIKSTVSYLCFANISESWNITDLFVYLCSLGDMIVVFFSFSEGFNISTVINYFSQWPISTSLVFFPPLSFSFWEGGCESVEIYWHYLVSCWSYLTTVNFICDNEITDFTLFILFILVYFIFIFYIKWNPYPIHGYYWAAVAIKILDNNNLESDDSLPRMQVRSPENNNNDDSDNDSDNLSISSQSQEQTCWVSQNINFKDLKMLDKINYIKQKIEFMGLNSNDFLIQYFISSIVSNTSGIKLEVDNFLNTNLNTILNDQRNTQLNKHAVVRYRPFLLHNTATSYFSTLLPYTQDNSFDYEWQEHLNNLKAGQTLSEEEKELLNKQHNSIQSTQLFEEDKLKTDIHQH